MVLKYKFAIAAFMNTGLVATFSFSNILMRMYQNSWEASVIGHVNKANLGVIYVKEIPVSNEKFITTDFFILLMKAASFCTDNCGYTWKALS